MLALSVKNLTKTYSNGTVALQNINLDVQQGDFFALLGQNGAGKSTTIGIVSSLINKTSGQVKIFDYDMDTHLNDAKSCLGVVPQEINFNPFEKVSHVILNQAGYYGIPRKVAQLRLEKYLRKLGLWEKRNGSTLRLSGGMKRRLMLARALTIQPKLLILDEPTAGVDIELRHVLWDFLNELNEQGTTIILTTHYLEEAEHLCKNVAIIDRGEIIEHANMKSLINRLNTQTVILDLTKPHDALLSLQNFESHFIDATTLEVKLHKQQSLNDLFAELNRHAINVNSMRNKTNRLEELFLNLVNDNNV